eukprot:Polyplicarium_translucidae@DN950_c0_g1_i1.p2
MPRSGRSCFFSLSPRLAGNLCRVPRGVSLGTVAARRIFVGLCGAMELTLADLGLPRQEARRGEASVLVTAPPARIACGLNHTLVVARRSGIPQLFGFGKNHSNTLGIGVEFREARTPVHVRHFGKSSVYMVSCGVSHSAVILKQPGSAGSGGKLFTFGLGKRGRLGYPKSGAEQDE